jgi:hypothetical protein
VDRGDGTRDSLVEPHALDERRVFDEAEQCRLGGHQMEACLCFGQVVR